MKTKAANLYEQVGELQHDMAETALACNEIAGRALSTLLQEHNEMVGICMATAGKQLETLAQARSAGELVAGEAQILKDFAEKMGQSVQEVRGIHRMASAEINLCLEDGWKAIRA